MCVRACVGQVGRVGLDRSAVSAGSAESNRSGRPGRVGRVGSAGRFGSAGSCRPGPTRPAPRRLAQHRLTPFLPCRQAPDMSNSNLRRNPSLSDSDRERFSPQIRFGDCFLWETIRGLDLPHTHTLLTPSPKLVRPPASPPTRVGSAGSAGTGRFGSAGSRPAPSRLAQHRLTPFLPFRQAPDMSNSNLKRTPSLPDVVPRSQGHANLQARVVKPLEPQQKHIIRI